MIHKKTINETIPEINFLDEEIDEVLRNAMTIDFYCNRALMEQLVRESPLLQAKKGLIDELKALDNESLEARVQEAKKKSLLQLNLFTKAKCDAVCDICYTSDLREYTAKNPDLELKLGEIKEVIDQAKEQGAKAVYVAGAGEPFCDPNFLGIVDYCKEKGMGVVAFTNGLKLGKDKALVEKLKKYDNLRLIGKVWHTEPKENNRLVGVEYTYKTVGLKDGRTLNLPSYLMDLIKAGVKVAIETCVRPVNYDSVKEDLIPFCKENSIPFVLEGIFYGGKAKENKGQELSQEQIESLVPFIVNHCKRSQYAFAVNNVGEGSHCHANIQVDEKEKIIINKENNVRLRSLFELMHEDEESVRMRYLCISLCPHYASYKWMRGEENGRV